MLLAGVLALAAIAVALVVNANRPDYRVLFGALSDKDSGPVIAQLAQMNVPYRLSEGGALMVPADRVAETKMKLGMAGLPKSTIDGYELLDKQKFGQTQAGENVSFRRALEGELMRTIGTLDAVDSAKVHLGLPAQSGFFREQHKPTASVVVRLHPGRTLDRAQIAGIVHIVSSSVPDLQPKAVRVADSSGALLTAPDADGSAGLDAQQLQYVQQVEAGLQRRVVELLEPVVGRENLRASVTAEIDFSESLVTSEEFKPNQGPAAASVKTQQTLESSEARPAVPSGVPGAQSNQPPVPASAPITGSPQALQGAQGGAGAGSTRRESTTNFEVDKTQRTVRNATGSVRRLSAAVVVNHRVATDPRGKTTSTPLSSEEIEKITALVQQGVGFNAERGDTVRVINAAFRADPRPALEEAPVWKQPWVTETLRGAAAPVSLAFVALLIVLTLIRPALQSLPAPAQAAPRVSAVVDARPELPLPGAPAALPAPPAQARIENARAMAQQNPAAVASFVRTLINGEQATA
jgi:flagellar M-ring protein FliF